MAHIVADRVLETSTTTGTGALTLAGAVTGFQAFSAVCATNDTVPYYIEAVDGSGVPTGEWETGFGTYSGANTLTRTTVYASSNSGSAVSLSAGTKRVGLGQLANTAKWTDIEVETPSSVSAVDFNDVHLTPYHDLRLVFEGVSHNNGSNTNMTIALSADGSTYGSADNLSSAAAATVAWYGERQLFGFRGNAGAALGNVTDMPSSPAISGNSTGLVRVWRCDGGIQDIRIALLAGSYDGSSTIRLQGR